MSRGDGMSRVFLSHSSRDNRHAVAVKAWLIEREPGLAEEIFLDLDPHTGIRPGERWRQALQQANTRCEAVICLLSKHWEASHECQTAQQTMDAYIRDLLNRGDYSRHYSDDVVVEVRGTDQRYRGREAAKNWVEGIHAVGEIKVQQHVHGRDARGR